MGVKGNQVRGGINAPKTVPVHREEIYERIKREQQGEEGATGVEDRSGRVLPTIIYCVNCRGFNVRVRYRARAGTDEQRWYTPNKGSDSFSGILGKDELEGQCSDCNSTEWDSIKEGNDWWNEFCEWFSGRGNH
jgi:hypothetical protein